jgi:acyl-CoA synthetase (AMP-forming)/AMP-acid ligase II
MLAMQVTLPLTALLCYCAAPLACRAVLSDILLRRLQVAAYYATHCNTPLPAVSKATQQLSDAGNMCRKCADKGLLLHCLPILLQACNRMSYVCVPLYETLGETAVEFILQHADVQMVFVEGARMARMVKALKDVHKLQALVYWGHASTADIKVRPCLSNHV